MQKQTKIVATVSDRNSSPEFIRTLVEKGADVFRLNTAHQQPEQSLQVIESIRKVSRSVGILIDTKGPEVRTLELGEGIAVKQGDRVAFSSEPSDLMPTVAVSYGSIAEDVPAGSRILIDDGDISFLVKERQGSLLITEAENRGTVKSRKSVNIPGVPLKLPSLTEKDRAFVKFAAENEVDFIAHSFVRNRKDIEEINLILSGFEFQPKIIAKIENREGVENAVEILDACHGIMVARGDLGIEIPAEEVPAIQKRLITLCRERAKPVITATQMLQSMIENPRPTRAEVSDIANAVLDGTSALMLSGETAYGMYPVEAVETMARIARAAEETRAGVWPHQLKEGTGTVRNFLVRSAVEATDQLDVKAIMVHTYSGLTARLLSSFRGRTPVFVKCHDMKVVRELSLSYGLYPKLIELPDSTDQLIASSISSILESGKINGDDLVVVLAGSPPHRSNESNLIEINTASNFLLESER